jgi:hypothetical protein
MGNLDTYLSIQGFSGQGYQPLVMSGGWQVSILNWEPAIDPDTLTEIECHKLTDEVFVLLQDRAALFVKTPDGIQVSDMEPGFVYTVSKGTWHSLVVSRDASLIIVENEKTDTTDTTIRLMEDGEMKQLLTQLPAWVR